MDNVLSFKSTKRFENWLERNHSQSNGIWMRMYKKHSGIRGITAQDALDAALCYGWITGQARKGTDRYALWWFCPRRKRSLWSKINTGHAKRLIREGRMRPSGLKEINEAMKDGRWKRAYHPQRTATLPRDFVKEVNKNRKARIFLKTLNRSETYAIIFRLHNTTEKKRRREKIAKMVAMLEEGRRL